MKLYTFKSKKAFANPLRDIDFHVFLGADTETHCHSDYYEILYITKGHVKYTINGENLLLEKGDMTIVRPQDYHKFSNSKSDDVQHVNLGVKCDYFRIVANVIDPMLLDKINLPKMPVVIKMLDSEFKEIENWKRKIHMTKTVNPDEMYTHASTLLCICLNMLSCKTTYSNSNFPAWFNSILDHINSSEFMECTVQDIYKLSNFSPPLIINAFKKYLGVTPVKYLTEVKMNYVCNLLKNTDFSILAICERVGYDSLSHFNRVFKKTKGKTPTEYRLSFKAKN